MKYVYAYTFIYILEASFVGDLPTSCLAEIFSISVQLTSLLKMFYD